MYPDRVACLLKPAWSAVCATVILRNGCDQTNVAAAFKTAARVLSDLRTDLRTDLRIFRPAGRDTCGGSDRSISNVASIHAVTKSGRPGADRDIPVFRTSPVRNDGIASPHEISAVTGHAMSGEAEQSAHAARPAGSADKAGAKMENGRNQEQEVPSGPPSLSRPGEK